jgi:hypothetical protein
MTPDMVDRLLQSIANAGRVSSLDDIDPCLVDETATLAPESCGCAFGGGRSDAQQLEFDEIPLHDAVETCHKIAERMRMYGE